MDDDILCCPFIYVDGRRCKGTIYRAKAYGPSRGYDHPERDRVRKYRLWCSLKDDHAGFDPGGKLRMEFYPDELSAAAIDKLWQGDLLG